MIILVGIVCFVSGTLTGIVLAALCTAASDESRRRDMEAALDEAYPARIDGSTLICGACCRIVTTDYPDETPARCKYCGQRIRIEENRK